MGRVLRGKKQQRNGVSASVHSEIPQEKGTEKIKVLSDISLPNVTNQWSTNNSQNSSYFIESYINNIQPVNTYTIVSEEQTSHINMVFSTNPTDIKVVESIDIPVSNDLFHLIDSLDYNEDLTSSSSANKINDGKTSTLNSSSSANKENEEKMSTTKSRRSSHSPESSKKRTKKLQVDVKNSSILRDILTKESHVIAIPDENDEKSKSTDMIFSEDDDMAVIIKAANIKKKLINEKCDIDREFACCLEKVNNLKNQVRHLTDQLVSAQKKLSDVTNYREKLAKKVKFAVESL